MRATRNDDSTDFDWRSNYGLTELTLHSERKADLFISSTALLFQLERMRNV